MTTTVYDDFTAPGGYSLADYAAKWVTPFGPGEMALADTRSFDDAGFHVSALPFQTSSDESVLDHLKYFALSTQTFPVPARGSVELSATITASTPGAEVGHLVHGTFRESGAPYDAGVLAGQQGAAVMNIIDFSTGQLLDWFVTGTTAFALVERLPSTVTGNTADPGSPEWVGLEKAYTQIVAEFDVGPGPHEVGIRLTRSGESGHADAHADWYLDGALVAHVDRIGIPLDRQGVPFTGTYPSLGPGEEVAAKLESVSIAHGLFSMLDAFPFGHPSAPELAVTITPGERAFGQGVEATFAGFRVETRMTS